VEELFLLAIECTGS